MPYVSRNGTIQEQQQLGPIGKLIAALLAVWQLILAFLSTIFSPDAQQAYVSRGSSSRGPRPPPGGGRRPGGPRIAGMDTIGSSINHKDPSCGGGG